MVVALAIVAVIPLANFIATSTSRTLFLSRSNDADWFAAMAESPLQTGDIANLRELAVRYQELYNTRSSSSTSTPASWPPRCPVWT